MATLDGALDSGGKVRVPLQCSGPGSILDACWPAMVALSPNAMSGQGALLAFRRLGIPAGRSVVAEVYPSLWMRRFPREERNGDQQAAYAVAAWMRRYDLNGSLSQFFNPALEAGERKMAQIEGWILGVV